MESFKEYCEGWIGLNRWFDEDGKVHSTPMERQEYYKIHMSGLKIKDAYDKLKQAIECNKQRGAITQ